MPDSIPFDCVVKPREPTDVFVVLGVDVVGSCKIEDNNG